MRRARMLAFLLCTVVALPTFAADKEVFTGRINGSKVRLRTEPSLEAHVVRETISGEMFAVTGEKEGFYAVMPPQGTKGYIFRTFVLDGVVEGDRVNVRLYPDMEAPIIARLNRGEKVSAIVSDVNHKWLVLDLPKSSNFYIAKEYVENCGPIEMLAQIEMHRQEGTTLLNSACTFAQAEIHRPFDQIDIAKIQSNFETILASFPDLPGVLQKADEANRLISEIYLQKKIAFLEGKANRTEIAFELNPEHVERLANLGIEIENNVKMANVVNIAQSSVEPMGLATTFQTKDAVTEQMLVWKPLEESIFRLWAATHPEKSLHEFYQEEKNNAMILSGTVEPYNRPVKNRPGDFLLKSDHLPTAFLYSTQVNLQSLVGKKVTIMATPRPNNHFAFPAYYVLSVE